MVPHLVTAVNGPLLELEEKILVATPAIERWFRLAWQEHTPPIYCAVDLRNSGFKLAPVDTNLFPGGFNNLAPEVLPLAVQAAMASIDKYCPDARSILIIPGNRIDDPFYLENLARLAQIFRQTGLNVRLGSLSAQVQEALHLQLADGNTLTVEPLIRSANGRRVGLKNFDPCTILLNNDLAQGVPAILENLHEQYLLPPAHAGWSLRRKTNHFAAYDEVAKKFGKLIDIDPWMLNPFFTQCGKIDFQKSDDVDGLAYQVTRLLAKIRKKYREYGIKEQPFIIVKADVGTYGKGIITIRDAKELRDFERFRAENLPVLQSGTETNNVIIQEGVYTFERMNDAAAEPVVYMIDRFVVGGYYRLHAERGIDENLKAPGVNYMPLAFAHQHAIPDLRAKPGTAVQNRFYMYGVVARLALLAASLEMERTDPDPEVD
jgi:glutamate--cysteine ligase